MYFDNIDSHTDFILEEIKNKIESWENNPKNWANNKRRMYGLRPLRGKNNYPKRKNKELYFYNKYKESIFKLMNNITENLILKQFNDDIKNYFVPVEMINETESEKNENNK